jgi:hypothetical protein
MYQLKTLDGKIVETKSGKELKTIGTEVTIPQLYGGEMFEISVLE